MAQRWAPYPCRDIARKSLSGAKHVVHGRNLGDILPPVISHDVISYHTAFATAWVFCMGKHTWDVKPQLEKVFRRRSKVGQSRRTQAEMSLPKALALQNIWDMLVTRETSLRVHQTWHTWYQIRCCRDALKQPCTQARIQRTAHHASRITRTYGPHATRTTHHCRHHAPRTTHHAQHAHAHAHIHIRTRART